MYRIFLAQQRIADQLPAVLALLDRWLTAGAPPAPGPRARWPRCSTGSIVATQLRYPSVGDLARAVRFRYFEEPVVLAGPAGGRSTQAERLLAELDRVRRARRRRRDDAPGSRRWSPAPSR